MDRFLYSSHGLGGSRNNKQSIGGTLLSFPGMSTAPSNHKIASGALPAPVEHFKTASVTPDLRHKMEEMGLVRVAGNAYRCTSTKDFWKVDGGKIVRMTTAEEVDNGESIQAAPADSPGNFLSSIMADLVF